MGLSRIAVLAGAAVVFVSISVGSAIAGQQSWLVKTAKGTTATGIFTNGSNQKVVAVAVKSQNAVKDPIVSFTFGGKTCALDGKGGATCPTVSVAPGKTATFRVTTKLAIAKVGFQGCAAAVSQASPGSGPGNHSPTPPAPGTGGGGNTAPPLHCERSQSPAKPTHVRHPRPPATVRARLRGLITLAIANETRAIADLKVRHTTAARGVLIKSIAELTSAQKTASSYDIGTAGGDVNSALLADRTVLASYTESPTKAQLARAQVLLRDAIVDKKAAIKALLLLH